MKTSHTSDEVKNVIKREGVCVEGRGVHKSCTYVSKWRNFKIQMKKIIDVSEFLSSEYKILIYKLISVVKSDKICNLKLT